MVGGRQPMVKDDLCWMTPFGGRQPSVKDDLRWKMTFGGRRPSVEDNLWWKTAFCGGWPSVEDDLPWKTTFRGKRPLVRLAEYCRIQISKLYELDFFTACYLKFALWNFNLFVLRGKHEGSWLLIVAHQHPGELRSHKESAWALM